MADILSLVNDKESSEFYPTPSDIVSLMWNTVNMKGVNSILEPSAGKGDLILNMPGIIADRLSCECSIDLVEIDPFLRSILSYNMSDKHEKDITRYKSSLLNECKRILGCKDISYRGWRLEHPYFINDPSFENKALLDEYSEVKSEYDQIREYDNLIDTLHAVAPKCHVVHDDFLTFNTWKHYDLIIMNPPFSNGDKHLLKALDMVKNGGQVVCLLNAETIKNPFTNSRKDLVKRLRDLNASYSIIPNGFEYAERKARVDVALVYVSVPCNVDYGDSFFEKIANKRHYDEPDLDNKYELCVSDYIKAAVARYNVEVEAAIELISAYIKMKPYLSTDLSGEFSHSQYLNLIMDNEYNSVSVNGVIRKIRLKYWKALFNNPKFTSNLTSTLQDFYHSRLQTYADYDFSEFNINALLVDMKSHVEEGITKEIDAMFEKLTSEHAYWNDNTDNRHYYDGWKTNKAWKIGNKVILPFYNNVFKKSWNDKYTGKLDSYHAYGVLSDIERILNFFNGDMYSDVDLVKVLRSYCDNGISRKIPCKFFKATFYKKGTVHLEFTCPELIERFNIYCGKKKTWLPPSYGNKRWNDLSDEEKSTVRSFHSDTESAELAYNKVCNNSDYYLKDPCCDSLPLLSEVC